MTFSTARDLGAFAVTVAALLGLAYRIVLVPNLDKHFGVTLREIQRLVEEVRDQADRVCELSEQITEVQRGLVNHIVVGRQAVGDLRGEVRRLARDMERHQVEHTGVPDPRRKP